MFLRLNKEFCELTSKGYVIKKITEKIWIIVVEGPQQSPFKGDQIQIEFNLDQYPFRAPKLTNKSKIFHPNLAYLSGFCCCVLDYEDRWAPTHKLLGILQEIKSLLITPSLKHCQNNFERIDIQNGTWAAKSRQMKLQSEMKG